MPIGRTYTDRHQADLHLGGWRHLERRRTVAQRPTALPTTVSRCERPVPAGAAGSDRPVGVTRIATSSLTPVSTTDAPPQVPHQGAMTSSIGK